MASSSTASGKRARERPRYYSRRTSGGGWEDGDEDKSNIRPFGELLRSLASYPPEPFNTDGDSSFPIVTTDEQEFPAELVRALRNVEWMFGERQVREYLSWTRPSVAVTATTPSAISKNKAGKSAPKHKRPRKGLSLPSSQPKQVPGDTTASPAPNPDHTSAPAPVAFQKRVFGAGKMFKNSDSCKFSPALP